MNSIDDGRSILVLGAGFSLGAENIIGESMPLANDLAKILSNELGEDEGSGLEEISGLYLDERERTDLLDLLKGMFTCKEPNEAQRKISTAPWKRIYTTNYDDVVESSWNKGDIASPTRSSDPRSLKDGPCCIHLNGFIGTVNVSNFDEEIMLTDVQYLTNELRDSPWAGRLRADFHSARNIFFVGYSLYDFDISKILFDSAASPKNIFFIQYEKLSRAQTVKFERFGELHRIGVNEFSELLENRDRHQDESLKHGFLSNFTEYDLESVYPEKPGIEVMRPFLSKGDVKLNCISWDIAQQAEDYRVFRPAMESISPVSLAAGSTAIIAGDIGSGKKVLLEEIALTFYQAQFRCFYFDGLSEDLADDIEYLENASSNSDVLIVFPDYYNHEAHLKLVRAGVPKAVVVTTSTIAALELSRSKPFDGDNDVLTVNLERLSPREVEAWDTLLDNYALWGDRAGDSPAKRRRFIQVDCGARLRDLMLFLFGQEQIKNEIKAVFLDAKESGAEARAQLVKYLAISASSHDPSFSEVQEILGLAFARIVTLGRAKWTYELLTVEGGRRKMTSSIFAQYLLREFVSDREVLDELAELATQLDQAARGNTNFSKLKNFPKRYSFVERLFADKGKREKLVEYYETLRQRGLGINDPQFWLQYAIARMSFKDYPVARDLFDTAYAKAGGMTDYDTYQIDNHYARFLLESSVQGADWIAAEVNFWHAHEILLKQMSSKRQGHYPYRVASNYLDFVEKFESDMSQEDLSGFVGACREVEDFLKQLKGDVTRNAYVKKCLHRIPRAIEYAEEAAFG
ncbi:SIR2 family protein [Rhodobacteraceae bacterium B1Z28]|uniref:SIR2 family protein n=1 Tax=Ruegeria haliotis TaxID=2747601 RepID=A0ABX2PP59_9RHOB|nr:SIR2 family protein [Ruegeria haliotis]NVO55007.1 SIR2 family protein [Ruegeria haliotis]